MGNRRVIYKDADVTVRFLVDDEGKASHFSMAADNGAEIGPNTLSGVPIEPLSRFAREYGNLTVNTSELKTPGRKPANEGIA